MSDLAPDASPAGEVKLDFKKILPIFLIVLDNLLGATYPLMQFIGAPILGRLSDRYGRKPVLVISQIGPRRYPLRQPRSSRSRTLIKI